MGKFIVGNVKWKQNEQGIQQFILFEADGISRRNGVGKSYQFKFWNQKTGVIIGGGSLVATDALNGEYDYTVLAADTLVVDDFIGELIEDPNGIGIRSDTFEVDIKQSSGIPNSALLQQLTPFGIKAIYIADLLVQGRLTQWNDQSGNNFHLTAVLNAEGDVRTDPFGRKVVTFGDSGLGGVDRMINSLLTVNSQDHSVMVIKSSYAKQNTDVSVTFDTDAFKGGIMSFTGNYFLWTNGGSNIQSSIKATAGINFNGIRATATSCELYNEDSQDDVGALSLATYTGINVGSWGAPNPSDPNLYCVVVFNTALSDSDFKLARTILMNHYSVLSQSKTLIVEGDSITEGNKSRNNENYPFYMKLPGYKVINDAVAGNQWSNLNSELAGLTALYYDATKSKNIIIVFAGTNDLAAGRTPAQAFADSETWVIAAKAAGWFVVQVTMLSSTLVLDSNRNTYCDSVVGGSSDLVIDVRELNTIGYDQAFADTNYFDNDGIHPLPAGYSELGEFIQSKIDAIL